MARLNIAEVVAQFKLRRKAGRFACRHFQVLEYSLFFCWILSGVSIHHAGYSWTIFSFFFRCDQMCRVTLQQSARVYGKSFLGKLKHKSCMPQIF
jgi:hypothetical protein